MVLDAQRKHWDRTFTRAWEKFGDVPSDPAIAAAKIFKKEEKTQLLELGGGQGRDTIYFAEEGFQVRVLDYSRVGLDAILKKAEQAGLSDVITTVCHDVKKPFPLDDGSFDACYSHMLYCMALRTRELEFLSAEIRRVLKLGGLNVYTVRHTGDVDYGTGIHRGEDMYEAGGFIVHFFNRDKVRNLAKGYEIVEVDEFEEGPLPRKLFRVTLRKKGNNR